MDIVLRAVIKGLVYKPLSRLRMLSSSSSLESSVCSFETRLFNKEFMESKDEDPTIKSSSSNSLSSQQTSSEAFLCGGEGGGQGMCSVELMALRSMNLHGVSFCSEWMDSSFSFESSE